MLSLVVFIQLGFSQDAWQNRYRSADLEINYLSTQCHDEVNNVHKQIIVLQFVNLTDNQLTVNYDKQMWFDGKCTGCDRSPEHQFTIKLEPRQTIAGSCENRNKALHVVAKMLNVKSTVLTKFEIADIKVSKGE